MPCDPSKRSSHSFTNLGVFYLHPPASGMDLSNWGMFWGRVTHPEVGHVTLRELLPLGVGLSPLGPTREGISPNRVSAVVG